MGRRPAAAARPLRSRPASAVPARRGPAGRRSRRRGPARAGPGCLGLFGRGIRVPSEPVPDDGFFARLARGVQGRRWLVGTGVAALLLLAGAPFLHARYENGGVNLLPASFQSRQVADVVAARFPGSGTEPVTVVARSDAIALTAYARQVAALPGVAQVGTPQQRGPGVASLDVVPTGASQGPTAQRLVTELRATSAGIPTYVCLLYT